MSAFQSKARIKRTTWTLWQSNPPKWQNFTNNPNCGFDYIWSATAKRIRNQTDRVYFDSESSPVPRRPDSLDAEDWAGYQEVDLELSAWSLGPWWRDVEKQIALWLSPRRKCHPGFWLWRRQHAKQKRLRPHSLCDAETGVGLDNRHLGTSLSHHAKGNEFAAILYDLCQMINTVWLMPPTSSKCLKI